MKSLTSFVCILLFAFGCSNEKNASSLENEIKSLEMEIGANPNSTSQQIEQLLAKYEEYAAMEGTDIPTVVKNHMTSGDMATRLGQFDRALGYYDAILENFPDNESASKALFMKAYTLDSKLGKLEEAKDAYELFLEKYPNDAFADDAEFSLKNLGKSAEEIIQGFETEQE